MRRPEVRRGGLLGHAGLGLMLAVLGTASCSRADHAVKDSATANGAMADSAQVPSAPDSASAPRVVPYDPSAPGAMRSGETPIRAAEPAPARVNAAPPKAPPAKRVLPKPAQPTQNGPAATPSPSRTNSDSIGDPSAIVRDYYSAIRAHDFLRAYRMWETSGQRGARSYAQFEAGFDSTETVDAKVGAPGRVEGAAGSRFITVPVEIDARLRNGTRQHFTGRYTLRRVVVPGASVAQRRWHLYAANIRQTQ